MIVRYKFRGEHGAIPMSNIKRMVEAKCAATEPQMSQFVVQLPSPSNGDNSHAVYTAETSAAPTPAQSEQGAQQQTPGQTTTTLSNIPADIRAAFARRKAGRPRKVQL